MKVKVLASIEPEHLTAIDTQVATGEYSSRSHFIRQAIKQKIDNDK